jgi:hypothetical protein
VVRSSDTAAQRLAKSIRDAANGAGGGQLGNPPALEKSALYEVLNRPPPRPRGRIAISDATDAKAALARVLGEPIVDDPADGAGHRACPSRCRQGPASEAWRTYERDRKRRWRAARRAAGLPGAHGSGRRGVAG